MARVALLGVSRTNIFEISISLEVMSRRGKTCLYKHCGGEALFCYVNLQVRGPVGRGEAKPCNVFHLGGAMLPTPYMYVPASRTEKP